MGPHNLLNAACMAMAGMLFFSLPIVPKGNLNQGAKSILWVENAHLRSVQSDSLIGNLAAGKIAKRDTLSLLASGDHLNFLRPQTKGDRKGVTDPLSQSGTANPTKKEHMAGPTPPAGFVPSLDQPWLVDFATIKASDALEESPNVAPSGGTPGPGGVTTSLELWLRADLGTNTTTNGLDVTSWSDQSGNANNASATNAPVYNTNNHNFNPSVDFAAANGDHMTIANDAGLGTEEQAIFVVGTLSTGSGNYAPFIIKTDSYSWNNGWAIARNNINTSMLYMTHGWNGGANTIAQTIVNDVPYIHTAYTGASDYSYNTHLTSSTPVTKPSSALNTTDELYIGASPDGTGTGTQDYLNGTISEIIEFSDDLTATERQRVASYLALKYGITLNNTGGGTHGDYIASNGTTTFWDASANSSYHHGVAGIGRDDDSALNQKQSKSTNTGSIVSIGLGSMAATNAANTNSFTADLSFMLWGHDNAATNQASANTTDLPGQVTERMSRVWKVQETGTVGQMEVQFDLTGLGYGTDMNEFFLIVSGSATMANGTLTSASSINGDVVSFTGVNLQDGNFFTLGIQKKAPGGVDRDLYLWLRADKDAYHTGTTNATDGQTVATWNDQSVSNIDAITDGNSPLFKNNSTDNINFNPTLDFDGIDDRLGLGNLAGIKAGSANGSDYTMIAVGFRESGNSGQYVLGSLGGSSLQELLFGYANNTTARIDYWSSSLTTTVSAFDASVAPFMLLAKQTNNRTLEETRDGSLIQITGDFSNPIQGSRNNFVGDVQSVGNYDGLISEIIVYSNDISDFSKQQIYTYLALKYGITLDHTGGGTHGDYIASNSAILWDASANSSYHNNVAGIGRDDSSELNQKQSKSTSTGNILSMGLGSISATNTANNHSFAADRSFMLWGHDNASTAQASANTTDLPDKVTERMSRIWKVQETGTVGQVEIQFDLTGLGYGTNLEDFGLIVSNSTTMASGTVIQASSLNGNVVSFTGVDLQDGDFFTLGIQQKAPGGVARDLYVWYKADQDAYHTGTTNATNGQTVTTWNDQSDSDIDATENTNPPLFRNNSTDNINFNPALDFDGTDDHLVLGNLAGIKSGSANAGDYTLIGVGLRESGGEHSYVIGSEGGSNGEDLVFGYRFDNQAFIAHWGDFLPLTVNSYNAPKTPYLLLAGYDGANRVLEETRNGSLAQNTGAHTIDIQGTKTNYIGEVPSLNNYHGLISEVIVYDNDITNQSKRQIYTYLALKYGITLDQTGGGTHGDYIASNGATFWDASANSSYHHNVTGIGRDDASELNQKQSRSTNTDHILSIGLGSVAATNTANTNSFAADRSFMLWGHDNAAADQASANTTDLPDQVTARMSRTWKVQETGTVGQVEIQFDLTGLGYSASNAYGLIVSNSATMASGTLILASSISGDVVSFTGVDLQDVDFFTLGILGTAPGGVARDLYVWYKADQDAYHSGTTHATDGQTVTTWNDQSVSNIDATGISNPPLFRNNSTDNINFNPALDFDGTDDYLGVGNLENIKASAANGGDYTLLAIGSRQDNQANFVLGQFTSGGQIAFGYTLSLDNGVLINSGSSGSDSGELSVPVPAWSPDPFMLFGSNAGTEMRLEETRGGIFSSATTSTNVDFGGTAGTANLGLHNNAYFNGLISEVIVYDNDLPALSKQQVYTYLALKYGITLDQTGGGTNGDYVASSGTTFWDASANSGYHNDVTGIGRDDRSELNQKQSRSTNPSNILSMGLGNIAATNAANTHSFTANNSFMLWGHDNAAPEQASANTTDLPDEVTARMSRAWKVQETGTIGPLEIQFDLSGLGYGTNLEDFGLIVSNSTTMASGTVTLASSLNGNVVSFTGVDLQDGDYFTLGILGTAPGGVTQDLYLWLKADRDAYHTGTTNATNGQTVTTWNDQSLSNIDATETTNPPLFRNNSTDNINFNPTLDFDGTDDRLVLGNLAGIKSGSANAGDYTLIGVGLRESNGEHSYVIGSEGGSNGEDLHFGYRFDNRAFIAHWGDFLPLTVNSYNAPKTPYLLLAGYDGANRTLEETRNGSLAQNTGAHTIDIQGTKTNYIGELPSFNNYHGLISEVIVYDNDITNQSKQQIYTYLALKYGMTLDQTGGGTHGDYIASNGATLWDASANSSYHHHVTGIGRDDASELNQKQSRSTNTDHILSIGLGNVSFTNASNSHSFAADRSFMLWGHDNAAADQASANTTDLPVLAQERMTRVWKVQETGTVDQLEIQFDLTGLGYGSNLDDFNLIVSNSATMASGTLIPASSINGSVLSFTDVDLQDGDFFTLATQRTVTAPGGITSDLYVWLRADRDAYNTGTNPATDGQTVTTWSDQSLSNINATTFGNSPLFKNNSIDNINFNPALDFDGTDDLLGLGNLAEIKSGGTNNGDYTIIGVGFRESDFPGQYILGSEGGTYLQDPHFGYRSNTVATMGHWGRELNLTVSPFNSPLAPYMLLAEYDGANRALEETKDGSLTQITIADPNDISGTKTSFIGGFQTFGHYNGLISEFIVYNNDISDLSKQQIYTYLAIKYGMTLDNTAGGTAGDYLSVAGTTIWDASANSSYHNDVTGIGRDDLSQLNQKQSKSTNTGNILSMGLGNLAATNTANTHSFTVNSSFMLWGHDNAAADQASANTTDLPILAQERMSRVWKVQETGTVGQLEIQFDLTGLGYGSNLDDFNLIVSNSATMASGTLIPASSINGSVVSFTQVDLQDGDFFTLATQRTVTAPGGITSDLYVWLRADKDAFNTGTNPAFDGQTVATWSDQSASNINATTDGNSPLFKNNSIDNINFNPTLDFDGTDDRLVLGNLAEIKSGGTNNGDYTLIGVGLRESNAEHSGYIIGSEGGSNGQDLHFGYRLNTSATIDHWSNGLNLTVNAFNASGAPYLLLAEYDGANRTLEETRNGSIVQTTNANTTDISGTKTNFVGDLQSNGNYNGLISEVIVYNNDISDFSKQQIYTYLAIKYGLTLDNTAGGTAGDYLSVAGTTIWDASVNSGYHHGVTGIGRDDLSELNQKQSKSTNSGSIVSMGLGGLAANNTANSHSFTANNSFMLWGHDNAATDQANANTSDPQPLTVVERMSRVWRVQETGTVGQVEIQFDLTGLGYGNNLEDFGLIVSNSPAMASGTVTPASSLNGNVVSFNSVDLQNGDFFTLATQRITEGPGGIIKDLYIWLRADKETYSSGTNPASDGQLVTNWIDQSASDMNATESTNPPQYKNNSTDNINFNPVLDFDGTDDRLNLADLANLKASAANGGDYTLLAVGERQDNQANFVLSQLTSGGQLSFGYTNFTNNALLVNFGSGSGSEFLFVPVPSLSATPYILFGTNTSAEKRLEETRGATFSNGTLATSKDFDGTGGTANIGLQGSDYYNGLISELIVFDNDLPALSKQQVYSYLAIKYGITLNNTGGGTQGDYLASNGTTTFWDASANSSYHHGVAGIGRDDDSALNQKQSKSTNAGSVLSIGLGSMAATNTANTNIFTADLGFMLWGHDNAATARASANTTDLPAQVAERVSRVWKVQETGTVGNVEIQFDLTGLGYGTDLGGFNLIVSNSAAMANGTLTAASSINGNVVGFTGIDLANGQYFTLATKAKGPGGIVADLDLWLRADEGTNTTTQGAGVTSWNDFSLAGHHASGTGDATYNSNWSNGNAAIEFTNDLDALTGSINRSTGGGSSLFIVGDFPSSASTPFISFGFSTGFNTFNHHFWNNNYSTNPPAAVNYSLQSGQPGLWAAIDPGNANDAFIYENGADKATMTNNLFTQWTSALYKLGQQGAGTFLTGHLSEVIFFDKQLSATERHQVESYLALKYGITLDNTGGGTRGDYLASNGTTTFWDASANSSYHHGVAGIGRDDDSALNQKQSKSANTGSIVSMGLGSIAANNAANTNSFTADLGFMLWGHDNAATAQASANTTDLPASVRERISRVWKVQETGTVGQVEIQFDLTGLGYGTDRDDFGLIVSNSATMANGTVTAASSISGNVVSFTGVDLADGDFFTLATRRKAPGGIASDLYVWFRADMDTYSFGTNPASDGQTVTTWKDQSGTNQNATSDGNPPTFKNNNTDHINFNPTLDFDGTDDRLALGDLANLKAGADNGGDYTLLAVGLRQDGNSNQVIEQSVGPGYLGMGYLNGDTQASLRQEDKDANAGEAIINTTSYNNPESPFILFGGYDGTEMVLEETRGSAFNRQTTATSIKFDATGGTALMGASGYNGLISEVIIYDNDLPVLSKQQVYSYLAIKYGLTLTHDSDGDNNANELIAGAVREGDYVASDGSTIIWDASANSTYHHGIAGIGRDDDPAMNQKQSKSTHTGSIVSMGLGSIAATNAANSNSFTADLSFMLWGHDNAAITQVSANTTDLPAQFKERMSRVWKVQETGIVGNVEIQFDLTGLGYGTTLGDFGLIVSNSATMASGLVTAASSINGNVVSFTGIDLSDGQYLTLATKAKAPGGIGADLRLWLKADYGITDNTEGAAITAWNDFSTAGHNGTGAATPSERATYKANWSAGNPAIYFANQDDPITGSISRPNGTASTLFVVGDHTFNSSTFISFGGNRSLWANRYASGSAQPNPLPQNQKLIATASDQGGGDPATVYLDGQSYWTVDPTADTNWSLTAYSLGDLNNTNPGFRLNGHIAEVIFYDRQITATERQQVESYLALKYGITLNNTGGGTHGDYLASNSTTVWDASANSSYHHGVAGIGRDDDSALNQKQSRSANTGSIVNMGLGSIATTNATNGNGFTDNHSFMLWGHDNATTDQANANTTDLPAGVEERISRIWKVQETGNVGNVEIQFDLTGLGYGTTLGDFNLIVSGSASMASGTVTAASSISGNVVSFTGVDLQDGDHFTLATQRKAPGGVGTNLYAWLKADRDVYHTGTVPANDGQTVSTWNDQSASDRDATQSTNQPLYKNNSTDNINFNPTLDFDGTDDFLNLADLDNIQDDAANGGDYTVLAVGLRQDNEENTILHALRDNGPLSNLTFGYLASTLAAINSRNNSGVSSTNEFTTTTYDNPQSPFILFADYDGSARVLEETRGSDFLQRTRLTAGGIGNNNNKYEIGRRIDAYYHGLISEIIVFNNDLPALSKQQVYSYLALKYGLTLTTDIDGDSNDHETIAGAVTEGDYVASDGSTIIWDASAHNSYHHGVAGMGRDDDSELNQKQSQSTYTGSLIRMGLGSMAATNTANTHSFTANNSFMLWGHDNAAPDQASTNTTDLPALVLERMSRVWKVQETGTVGEVEIQFDLTGLGYGTNLDDFNLIVSGSASMVSGNLTAASSINGNVVSFTGVDLQDGDFFTLGTRKGFEAPGGITTDLYTWLRADKQAFYTGTTNATDGQTVTSWNDQSGTNLDATADGNPPLYKNNGTDNINFNPALDFDGTDDRLVLGDLVNLKAGAANGGDYTLLAVGLRQDASANDVLVQDGGLGGKLNLGYTNNTTATLHNGDGFQTGTLDMTTTAYNNPELPYVLFGGYDGSQMVLEETRGSAFTRQTTATSQDFDDIGGTAVIGGSSDPYNGLISEVIVYENDLPALSKQQVYTYLALKYGLTLTLDSDGDNNANELIAGAVREGDYVASDGSTIIWDASANSTYHHGVAGIGRNDESGLEQRQGKSTNNDHVLSIGLGSMAATNAANTHSFTSNYSFMLWGHDNATTAQVSANTTDLPAQVAERISRVWKVQETGTVGQVEIQFDLTGLGYGTNLEDLGLIVSNNATMANGTLTAASSINGNTVSFTGIDLQDGQYFTLATRRKAPGGVLTNLYVWLRADQEVYNSGTTSATDGQTVTTWNDQSGSDKDAVSTGTPPLYKNNSTDNINFNPTLDFDGSNDRLNLGDLVNLQADAANGGDYTLMAVGLRQDANTNYVIRQISDGSLQFGYLNDTQARLFQADKTLLSSEIALSTTSHNNPESPFMLLGSYDGTEMVLEETRSNAFNRQSLATNRKFDASSGTALVGASGYHGLISELIVFDNDLPALSKQQVYSYLALKYSLTLTNDSDGDNNANELIAGAVREGDYVTSDGSTIIWDASVNSTYHHGLAGMGRDDLSQLNQKQSKSTNAGSILSMGLGGLATTNAANGNSFSANHSFMLWGHDNAPTAQASANLTDLPVQVAERISRVWKVQETGTVGNVEIQFDLTGLGYGNDLDEFHLIVSNTAAMANGTLTAASSISGNVVSFTGIDLQDGDFFTLATGTPAPGGIATDLRLWLRADKGPNTTTQGAGVTAWNDLSGAGHHAIGSGDATYNTNWSNGNPAIEFTNDPNALTGSINRSTGGGSSLFIVGDFPSSASTPFISFGFSTGFNTFNHNFWNNNYSTNPPAAVNFNFQSGQPGIWGAIDPGNANDAFIYENGADKATMTNNLFTQWNSAIYKLGQQGAGTFFTGHLAEVIFFDKQLSVTERQKVESYLALKYGITLENTGGNRDYVASDGTTTFWDASVNSGYHYSVAGIGRDDDSALNQKQNKSANTGSIVSIGLGSVAPTNLANSNGFNANHSFMLWGHDNAATDQANANTTDLPAGVEERISRVWKVQETGTVGQVEIQFDLTGLGYGNNLNDFNLIVSGSASMANGSVTAASSISDNAVSFTGVDLQDGDFFSLATQRKAPGGIATDLYVWLRADQGARKMGTAAIDGQIVTSWKDQSGTNLDATADGNPPLFKNNSTDNINFNPALDFDGTDDRLALGDLANLKAGAANGGDYTLLAVGLRQDANDGYILGQTGGTDGELNFGFLNNNTATLYNDDGSQFSAVDMAISAYNNPESPFVLFGGYDGLQMVLEETRGSAFTRQTTATGLDFNNIGGTATIGGIASSFYNGLISELIVFDNDLPALSKQQVYSYLALKYGLTLTNDSDGDNTTNELIAGVVREGDYVASNGTTTLWDASTNSSYHHGVAGIGRDDGSALNQKQSKSANSDAIVTMGLDDDTNGLESTNAGNPSTFGADHSFLAWGNDGAGLNSSTAGESDFDPLQVKARLNREWKVQETGTVGTVTLQFDVSGLPGPDGNVGTNDENQMVLLVDNDSDFTSGASVINQSFTTVGDGLVNFRVDFTSGQYFTLASQQQSALAVTLLSLEAKPHEEGVLLLWSTATEKQNSYFRIERSSNGEHFETAGYVQSEGTSSAVSHYTFLDRNPHTGNSYYRLVDVDFGGNENISPLVRVEFQPKPEISLPYPNPVRSGEKLHIHTSDSDSSEPPIVYNLSGASQQVSWTHSKNQWHLDTTPLVSGIYMILVKSPGGNRSHKIMVRD